MIVALLPWIAFLGALGVLLTPTNNLKTLRCIAVGSTLLCLAVTLYLFCGWDHSQAGFQHVLSFDFFPAAGIYYQTGIDGIGLIFCLLTALVASAGIIPALRQSQRLKAYLLSYLLLTGCLFSVFTVLNIFFLYLFYEMTLIPIFIMFGLAGSAETKKDAVIRLAIYMTVGAVAGLFAILSLYHILGPEFLSLTQSQALLAEKASLLTPQTQQWFAGLLIVGFGVMTVLFPFHSWAPITYGSAPVSLAILHAGVKAGPYILLRLAVTYLPEGFRFWAAPLAFLAAAGILYGGLVALRQKNLRGLAAFSSISHMGYIFLAFAALNEASLSSGILLTFAHGLMIACFFALIEILENRSGTDQINSFGGLGKSMPFIGVCFMLIAMASSGVPGFVNFPAELIIFISSWRTFPLAVSIAVLGVLITAVYMIRAVHAVCFGAENPSSPRFQDARGFEKLPFFILLSALIVFGIFPSLLLKVIQPAIKAIL